jgi:beta-glucosidase
MNTIITLKGLRQFVVLIPFLLFPLSKGYSQTYLDSAETIEARVNDLLDRMTLQEKVGQMTQINLSHLKHDPDIVSDYYLGSVLSGGGSSPDENTTHAWAQTYDSLQKAALDTRLGIPIIYGIDAVHGHNNLKDAVIFPHNIGLGATRNPELVEKIGKITALEVAATGIDWTFAPCIAVPRNERWGRTYEGFGETPELVELLGTAFINGIQGDTLADDKSILACAKHFIGDGGTTGGVDQGDTELSEENLRSIHLPAYIDAIENGVGSIMATYNSWNGKKVHGSKYLLTDVLKKELGFKGFVVSDWSAIDQLPGNYQSDIKESINAGIDMVMVPDRYEEFTSSLAQLVNSGEVSMQRIDDAVRRILRIKFQLGLFEHPFTKKEFIDSVGTEGHREIARQAVRESMVLLKKKDDVLPLQTSGEKILIAGVGGNDIGMQCGGWTISWQGSMGNITDGTTILEGIQNRAGESNVIYSKTGETTEDFDKAVVVIGETPYAEMKGDREDLTISDEDIELVREIYQRGKPTIIIIMSGRPLIINPILHYSDAIIAAWLPGTEGDGVAEVLFGEYQPSGKLGYSWLKYMDQLPINVGDDKYDPLFEYGYGLTSISNSNPGSNPNIYSAVLTKDAGAIELSFNKIINGEGIDICNFSLTIDEETTDFQVIPEMSDSGSKSIILSIPENIVIAKGERLSISYISGNIESKDGGILQPFENELVYNILNEEVSAFIIPGKIEAEDYTDMMGIQLEQTSDIGGGQNVGWIDAGDWMSYLVSVPEEGTYRINYRVAAESENGIISFMQGDDILQSILLPVTSGWQIWETVPGEVELTEGEYLIKLYASSGGFNVNWFSFDKVTNIEKKRENNRLSYSLKQNFPNPFNPSTKIRYTLKKQGFVKLSVYNLLGERIGILVNEKKTAGEHFASFNAKGLSSGVYLYKITIPGYTETKKMLLLE